MQIISGPRITTKHRNLFIALTLPENNKMVTRKGGIRRKTRYKFRKEKRDRGKISLTRYLQTFKLGDRVYLDIEPAVQKGAYHPRFMGKSGIVKGTKGKCYEVLVNDLGKEKTLVVHPVHLKRA